MKGIDPNTGLSVSGHRQAAERLKRAITTQVGTRPKRRKVGGGFRKLMGEVNEANRHKAINRIHRIIANPANDLADIEKPVVEVFIMNAGFRIRITYTYAGKERVTEL